MLGTCESAICVRVESRVESGVKIRIRIESRIESAIGPRRATARRTTAVGRYHGAPLMRDVGVGAGQPTTCCSTTYDAASTVAVLRGGQGGHAPPPYENCAPLMKLVTWLYSPRGIAQITPLSHLSVTQCLHPSSHSLMHRAYWAVSVTVSDSVPFQQ